MDWQKAKFNLDKYYQLYPNHTSKYLVKAYYLRWKHYPILESNNDIYQTYLATLDSAEKSADLSLETNKLNLEHAYYKMTSHIMRAELHAHNEDMVKAAMEGKNAFGIIKKGFDWCQENPEFYISTGLYNYYVELYREKGFFYQSLLWPFSKGDKLEGLEYLKKGSAQATFSKVECEIFLAHLIFKMQNNPSEGLSYLKNLRYKYPNNTKFAEMEVENLLALNQLSAVNKPLSLLTESENSYTQAKGLLFKNILHLLQGKGIAEDTNGLKKSVMQFEEMEGDQEHYLSLAYLYLSRAERLLNNDDEADDYFDMAEEYAKYPYIKVKLEEIESL